MHLWCLCHWQLTLPKAPLVENDLLLQPGAAVSCPQCDPTSLCTCFSSRYWGSRRLWVPQALRSLAQGNTSYWNKVLWRKAKRSNSPSLWSLQSSTVLHVTPKRDTVLSPISNEVLGRLLFLTENSWLCVCTTRQKDCCQSFPLKCSLTLSHSSFLHAAVILCAILAHSCLARINAVNHAF